MFWQPLPAAYREPAAGTGFLDERPGPNNAMVQGIVVNSGQCLRHLASPPRLQTGRFDCARCAVAAHLRRRRA